MAARGSLELLTFLPNQPRQRPFYRCDGRGVGAFASNCPTAGSQTWTSGPVKLLCRENLALSTAPVLSDVSFEGSAIIRAGGSTHALLQATPDMGRTRWILILCAWTIVGLLFAVRRIVLVEVQGTHVSWVIAGAPELGLLVRMGGVHTACDWSGQTVPVDRAEVSISYSDPHNHVAHNGSPGSRHRILSEPRTCAFQFFASLIPPCCAFSRGFTVSVLSMALLAFLRTG